MKLSGKSPPKIAEESYPRVIIPHFLIQAPINALWSEGKDIISREVVH
jgi:hypothetical protein